MAETSGMAASTGAEVTALAGNMVQLHQHRLSSDNAIRKEAEKKLAEIVHGDAHKFLLAVLFIIRSNSDRETRLQAALHLKILVKDSSLAELILQDDPASQAATSGSHPTLWSRLTAEGQRALTVELFNCLESGETVKPVRHALCDTVSMVACRMLKGQALSDVEQRCFQLVAAGNIECQISGLQLLTNLAQEGNRFASRHISALQELVMQFITSPSADVRYHALGLVSGVLESEKRSVWKLLQPALSGILEALTMALRDPESDDASDFLVTLVDMAEIEAAFFAPQLFAVTSGLCNIAVDAAHSDSVRQLCLELVLAMCESKPKMCAKSAGLVDLALKSMMELLLCVEEDPEWENKTREDDDDEDGDEEETTNYHIAEGGLDRLGTAIGGELVLPKLFDLAVQYLHGAQWQMRHAALVAISQTVEHIPEDKIDKYLERLLPLCIQHLADPHPRVRFAACRAIGQAAADTSPLIQENHLDQIMPALIRRLDDPVIRLQSHAAQALSNFCESVRPEALATYLDALVEKLLQRVTLQTPQHLLSTCVTTMAVVASSADKYFVKYYSTVVPSMKAIVQTYASTEEKACREKALECITLVALSIGAKAFQADASECMDVILKLWLHDIDSQVAGADGQMTGEGPSDTLNESLCRMCRVLEAGFVEYLPLVLPRIFKIISQKPQQTDFSELTNDTTGEVSFVGNVGGQTVGMKSQIVREIEQMLTLLLTIVSTLGEQSQSWVSQIVQHVLLLLDFQYCEKVMQYALNILTSAVEVARKFGSELNDPNQQKAYLQLLSEWVWRGVDRALAAIEDDPLLVDSIFELPRCAANLLKAGGSGILSAERIYFLSKCCVGILGRGCTRHEDVAKGRQDEHDEDDEDDIQGEERYELEIAGSVTEILNALVERHADLFIQTGSAALVADFARTQMAAAAAPHHTAVGGGLPLTLAMYIICELIGLGDQGADFWTNFVPALIEAVSSSEPGVRQPAAYGIRLLAKSSAVVNPATFCLAAQALVASLEKTDRMKQPLDDSIQSAVDNATSAIGSLVFQQSAVLTASGDGSLEPNRLLGIWMTHLPLKADEEEAKIVHEELVQAVLANNSQVLGQDLANMPHLLKIFAKIYKTDLSTPKINEDLVGIARTLGEAAAQSVGPMLEADELRNLERLFLDARPEPQTT